MQSRERPTLARRSLLAGMAALPAVAVPALPAVAALPDPDGLGGLWRAYLLAKGAANAASDEQDTLTGRLPWWAKSGPSWIDGAGNHVGDACGAPAIQDVEPSTIGGWKCIRPTERTILADFTKESEWFNDKATRAVFERRMEALKLRQVAQREERTRVGLDEIDARYEAACDVSFDRYDDIMALPRGSAAVAAAQIMVTLAHDCDVKATAGSNIEMDIAAMALGALLPQLKGELATDAAEFVMNRDRRIDAMRASTGIA